MSIGPTGVSGAALNFVVAHRHGDLRCCLANGKDRDQAERSGKHEFRTR
jgi:hypothetical protein